jgi:hypothetical protein
LAIVTRFMRYHRSPTATRTDLRKSLTRQCVRFNVGGCGDSGGQIPSRSDNCQTPPSTCTFLLWIREMNLDTRLAKERDQSSEPTGESAR